MSGTTLTREDSASSKKSGDSVYCEGSSIYPKRAKNVFKQHMATVEDIVSDIGQLQIFHSGDTPLESLLAQDDVPENATILQDFRRGVQSGDIKPPVSSPCRFPFITTFLFYGLWLTSPPAAPSRPRKLQRRPRKDSIKTPIHGGIISSPLEASMDVHPGEIIRAVTVADGILHYSPYESLRSYKLSQPTVEEEEKFFADLITQINKNTLNKAEPATPTQDSYISTSSAAVSSPSDGMLGDLSSEQLLAARKENTEKYGW
ncbi:hypothetical protein B9Z19DRAFT_1174659 [Tuber borchii]|uniref:Uncharacterized protein n=1 Tax=Tuber borchii TaxID=42251 RepID=A0A2T6ZWH5_TUBBO|nr:hypothetical protein B9Z19DRAFT_1174659 [Tuber borchii]